MLSHALHDFRDRQFWPCSAHLRFPSLVNHVSSFSNGANSATSVVPVSPPFVVVVVVHSSLHVLVVVAANSYSNKWSKVEHACSS